MHSTAAKSMVVYSVSEIGAHPISSSDGNECGRTLEIVDNTDSMEFKVILYGQLGRGLLLYLARIAMIATIEPRLRIIPKISENHQS